MKRQTMIGLLPALALAIFLIGCQSIGVATSSGTVGASAAPTRPPTATTMISDGSSSVAASPSAVPNPDATRSDVPDGRRTIAALGTIVPEDTATSEVPIVPTISGPLPTGSGPLPIPLRVRIPRIHVNADVEVVGLDADGTMGTPRTVDDIGWYGYGPIPGEPGASVLAGHVDSVRGPAVFWSLHELRTGDRIDVDLVGGLTRHFVVEGIGTYPSDEAPISTIFALAGSPRLNLITCGGIFDRVRRAYDQRLVVYARLDSTTARQSAAGPTITETPVKADVPESFLAHVADATSAGSPTACSSTVGRCE